MSSSGPYGPPPAADLASVIRARLARAGVDPYGRELAFIAAWNATVRELRNPDGLCGWPSCPEWAHRR
jgi:hypothetical protein